ncbi:uncharacterized protein LOC122093647 [Macadamia integrifolia]|uniref:uncharacterized protein LOC122093647 n=1 Tax=Macadamia integrifolia TaxID=60698 RepID=UPI001C52B787|nr:uncharacterized protein LOC122093647 [Macadamia integrifolia]
MGSEINSNQGKEKEKKTKLIVCGGAGFEIGKLVVLGGALAAGALIAALTNKARKRRLRTTTPTQKSIEDQSKPTDLTKTLKNGSHCSCAGGGNEGLRSLLPTPSQSIECQHNCCCYCDDGLSKIDSTHINFSQLVVVQSLILDANVNNSKEETDKNIPAFEFDDYNINKAETPVSAIEALQLLNDGTCPLKQEDRDQADNVGGSPTVDGSSSEKSNGEGEADESFEEEEEGSEVTPDSSVESSAEAVWPAESIEAEMLDLKENKADYIESDSAEKNGEGAKKASRVKDGEEYEIIGRPTEILDQMDDMEFNMADHPSLSASSRSRFLLCLTKLVVLLMISLAITSLSLIISLTFMT